MAEVVNAPRSAYLHIPFCHRRCFYCDFPVVPLGDKANGTSGTGSRSIKSYLGLLHREISLASDGPPLSTIYIGGGTPSLLSPGQIKSLLDHLRNQFGFQDGVEITMEIDPASFDQRQLEGYQLSGINRVSLGGQSFNDKVLEQIGRRHRNQDLLVACELLKDAFKKGNITSWSIDLIQNLPEQDLLTWENELINALATGAPHLSVYELSIEPGTVFEKKRIQGQLELPNDDLAIEIMRLTSSKLREAGFSRYEISNFALPGHASRHNRAYWSGVGWWGFGQGATSAPWGMRLARPRTRDGYRKWLENQEKYGLDSSLDVVNARPMAFDDQLIVGLRRREGIDLSVLASSWGWDINQRKTYLPSLKSRWKKAIKNGWLKHSGERFYLSDPYGMEISNQILVEILLWWESLPVDAVV